MAIPTFSEAAIRQHATAESFRRGQSYCRQGMVTALVQRGQTLQAAVEGSQYEPYHVRITFDAGGITGANCDCPYDWGGWCKHIVATLLVCLHEPDQVEERPPLDALLADLDQARLRELLLHLAAHHPYLTEEIEAELALQQAMPDVSQTDGSRSRRAPVDPQPARRRVRQILRSLDHIHPSEAHWHTHAVTGQMSEVLNQVRDFTEAGDGGNALILLEAITEEYVEGWVNLDDSDGYLGGFFEELGEAWTEACLVVELPPEEREEWARKLTRSQGEVDEYGIESAFDAAQAALLQGWDYPPLQRVLQGEITRLGAWEETAPWFADELAVARLRVLERQERYQEYLYLAQAEGQVVPYVMMLARLGRAQEAVAEGLDYLYKPNQCLALAKALHEREDLAAALQIAAHGLTLDGTKANLAVWLRDLADGLGDTGRALDAALIALQERPSLADYERAQELAGERWPGIQEEFLARLRRASGYHYSQAQVDIFLHEGLLDDAIAAVEKDATYTEIAHVMDAVIDRRPEWVIKTACRHAERIMEARKAKNYHYAVDWLERARAAYRAAGREAEWQAYLEQIRTRHARKYKLMGMLKGFDRI